jgi:hypothetical protein
MIFNRFALFLALVIAIFSSQLPEFAQQYKQRLGGAIDELNHIIADFEADAAQQGMDRAEGIASLEANEDPFVRGRGVQMREIASRRDRLERQLHDLDTAQPIGELVALGENFDGGVAANVLSDFEPAVPVTSGGLLSALLGFAAGLAAIHLCAWPVRRHYRRRMAHIRHNPAVPA